MIFRGRSGQVYTPAIITKQLVIRGLFPADGNCTASNVTAPVVIDLSGHDTHDYRNSSASPGVDLSVPAG